LSGTDGLSYEQLCDRLKEMDALVASIRNEEVDAIVGRKNVVLLNSARRFEEALRESEEHFKMLFDTMLNGFALHEIIYDDAGKPTDFRYLAVNPAFERLTGLKAEQVVGRRGLEVFPNMAPERLKTYMSVDLSGKVEQFEYFNTDLGKYLSIAVFRSAPGRFGVMFVDQTDRRRTQDELARNEAELTAIP